jgi:hypothetical protein
MREVKDTLYNIVISASSTGHHGRTRRDMKELLRANIRSHAAFQSSRTVRFDMEVQAMDLQEFIVGTPPEDRLVFEYLTADQLGLRCVMTPPSRDSSLLLEILVRVGECVNQYGQPIHRDRANFEPVYFRPSRNGD